MELNEIVNPYFSFPVVGVVICAVLVYAFGFKAPVQPPSFDFEGDKKLSKKRKVSKKALSNGNATTILTTSSNLKSAVDAKLSKTSSPKARQTSTAALNSSNGINSQLVVTKTEKEPKGSTKATVDKKNEKNKKEKIATKSSAQEEVAKPIPKVIEGKKEDGEWVQTLSRKEKKNRKREENVDDFIKDALITNYRESNTPSNSKENSPSKKKKATNKNDINKSKVMKEKLDDNIETPSLLKPIGDNVIPVKNENKSEAQGKKGELKENKVEKKENKSDKKENKVEKKETKIEKKENKPEIKENKSVKKENKPETKDLKSEKNENNLEKKEKENKSEKKVGKSDKKDFKLDKKDTKPEKKESKSEKSEKEVKNEAASIKSEAKSGNAINGNLGTQSTPKKAKNVDVPKSISAAANEKINIKNATSMVAKEEPAIIKVVVDVKPEPTKAAETQVGKVAFDELGDPWEETKSQKKKKKTRRDQ